MTYCLAIKINGGIVFASDSRTNAGVDYVTTYSKMHVYEWPDDRVVVLLSAGSLATTQGVLNTIQRDLESTDGRINLRNVDHLFDAAHYIGGINQREQQTHSEALSRSGVSADATFILGGQIKGRGHEIYLIYPQGNYISASPETPYLQIGENKYGKPILDRVIVPDTTIEDAARCCLVSLDSTMRSNISVGPPFELAMYWKDELELRHYMNLKLASPLYKSLQKRWNEGLKRAFNRLPRFDWEQAEPDEE